MSLVRGETEMTKAREGSSEERNSTARSFSPSVGVGPVKSVKVRSGGDCSEEPRTGSKYVNQSAGPPGVGSGVGVDSAVGESAGACVGVGWAKAASSVPPALVSQKYAPA